MRYYWHATVRYENETSEEITIQRGVRQGCILSPCLFHIYTEYLIREALEDGEGITINGQNITNIRYAERVLRSNISMKTRIRILMCYVFSVVSYGCETWTYSKAIDHIINAFEMWCYRRMLRISWTSHTTNIDVLQKIGVKEITMLNNVKNRTLSYAGHMMRNTSGHYDTVGQEQACHGGTFDSFC